MTASSSDARFEIGALSSDEKRLWDAYAKSRSTFDREHLFRQYQHLAKNMAVRYRRSNAGALIEYAELYQLACVGLLESIDRFKPELGVPFRYFANRRISGAILNGIAKHSELSNQISVRKRMERDRIASLSDDSIQTKSIDAQLDFLGEIAASLAFGFILDDASVVADVMKSWEQDAFDTLAWKQMVKRIQQEIHQLQPQHQNVLIWHYNDGLLFEHIAAILGLSKGRVSQIHKAAIALLRKRMLNVRKIWLEG
jgi:RNA polymerase sigma factor FliA